MKRLDCCLHSDDTVASVAPLWNSHDGCGGVEGGREKKEINSKFGNELELSMNCQSSEYLLLLPFDSLVTFVIHLTLERVLIIKIAQRVLLLVNLMGYVCNKYCSHSLLQLQSTNQYVI